MLVFFYFFIPFFYILNIATVIKKMSVTEIKDFFFENYYKTIAFSKESNYYSMECLKKKNFLLICLQAN